MHPMIHLPIWFVSELVSGAEIAIPCKLVSNLVSWSFRLVQTKADPSLGLIVFVGYKYENEGIVHGFDTSENDSVVTVGQNSSDVIPLLRSVRSWSWNAAQMSSSQLKVFESSKVLEIWYVNFFEQRNDFKNFNLLRKITVYRHYWQTNDIIWSSNPHSAVWSRR